MDIIDELLGEQWPFIPLHPILKEIDEIKTAKKIEKERKILEVIKFESDLKKEKDDKRDLHHEVFISS